MNKGLGPPYRVGSGGGIPSGVEVAVKREYSWRRKRGEQEGSSSRVRNQFCAGAILLPVTFP